MSRIIGVMCDGCRKVDAVSNDNSMAEDLTPRNGWVSLTFWGTPREGSISPVFEAEFHACSIECVEVISSLLKEKREMNRANSSTDL